MLKKLYEKFINPKRIVVIVDDDLSIVEIYKDIVIDIKIDLIEFKIFDDALKCFEYIKDNYRNIISLISDEKMPVLTGGELCEQVKKLNPAISTMVITAYDSEKLYMSYKNAGGYVDKVLSKLGIEKGIIEEINRVRRIIKKMLYESLPIKKQKTMLPLKLRGVMQ